jgi:sarcosine oxidase subunit delta
MLRIECPWCGLREEPEFICGGESHIAPPVPNSDATEWAEYLFNRDNPKGLNYEHWLHHYGCGRWFNVVRDTVTHELQAVYQRGDPKPDLDSTASG